MNKNVRNLIFSSIVFVVLFCVGLTIARHKPLWDDEIFSQMVTIDKYSYFELFTVPQKNEGNACPLHFVLQKVVSDLGHFSSPKSWIKGERQSFDPYAMILLRINSILFMSLTGMILFYYFGRIHSLWMSLLSLFLFLSSYMIIMYWAEARQYTLWIFLTTVQIILCLEILKNASNQRLWIGLGVVNLLLSLTVVFSVAQIAIIMTTLWLFLEKNSRKHIFAISVPIIVGLWYYFRAPVQHDYWVPKDFLKLIYTCFSIPHAAIFVFLSFIVIFQKDKNNLVLKAYSFLTMMMIFAALGILLIFKLKQTTMDGFPVYPRYFIFLTPVNIIAVTLSVNYLVNTFQKNKWMLMNVLIICGGLILLSSLQNWLLIIRYSYTWSF